MATTTAAAAAIASPTVTSRRKGGSKRSAEDADRDASPAVKRAKTDSEASPEHNYDGAVLADDHEEVVQAVAGSNGTAASKASMLLGWPVEELSQLVKNLESCLPANDLVKYTTMVEKVDWERVRFSTYSAAQCKEKWMQLMQKLRRYRTLTDMVADAYAWLQQPGGGGTTRRGRNPALPKKPLTPYFRYFLEKRAKYACENPELSMTQLAKVLSTKFQQLSDKKKQKYKDSFEKDNAVYKAELKKFKTEHPDEFPEPGSRQTAADGAPGKPQTPFQLFAADRLQRPDLANLDKKEAQEEIRRQWAALSDGKRLKWIRRALQGQHRYEEEIAEYSQAFPGFKAANTKPVLSKAEQEFKDKCEGKPERPPNSGYSLFSRIMLRQLKNVPAKEKMGEISRLWKGLSQGERDSYNKQATKANAKYKEKYAAYLSNLPEEERLKLESEVALPKGSGGGAAAAKKAAAAAALSTQQQNGTTGGGDENQPPKSERHKPKKPLSAMFFFQQEKVAHVREKHPDMSKQEIMRLLAREFSELPDRKKEKYQKMASEAKQKEEEETNGYKVKEEKSSTPHPSKRQKLYKGEPKKPPQSGYGVFSTEMLSQLVDVDPKQRMAEIARRWNAMPDEDKERYKNMVQDLQRKYTKELRKFLENLSPEDRAQYEELQVRIKDQRKGGAAAARATPKAKAKTKGKEQETPAAAAPHPEEEEEESSSSSSSESSSEESSDEEEEEEQGEKEKQKEGGSEEESDSSSEESDSDSDSSSSSEEEKVESKAQRQPPANARKTAEDANAEESSDSDSSEDSSNEEDDDDDDSSDSDSDSK